MAQTGKGTGLWRSVRELPERTPLRVKLMTAVLALVTIALVVISVAGIAILKSSLLGQYDSGMRNDIDRVASTTVSTYLVSGGQLYAPGQFVDWIPSGGGVQRIVIPTSQGYQRGYPGMGPGPGRPESEPAVSGNPAWINSHLNKPFTLTSASGDIKWRVMIRNYEITPTDVGTVVLAADVTSVYTTIGKLATIDLLVSIAVLCLVGVLGIALVRASLRALTDIEKTAGAIAAGDMSRRVPERDPRTEVGRLGRSLNAMLSQIESAFRARSRSEESARHSEEKMRQFVADASHELRTPLTAIRGFAEYYRQRGGIAAGDADGPEPTMPTGQASPSGGAPPASEPAQAGAAANGALSPAAGKLASADMDRIMRRVEQESARMGILVEDMLLLARLDQQRPLMARPVDLLTLAADAVHDARVVAPARTINLTVNSRRALLVIGDEVRLRQVIGNLMSNALTHTPEGTPIEVLIRSGNLDEAAATTAVARPDIADEPSFADEPAGGGKPAKFEAAAADLTAAFEATAADDIRWDADHVPPPPGSVAPGRPAAPTLAGPAAVIEVADHGPGLTREQAGHVFERFYRADPARTTGGTGLGLAIVAALVAAHGGTAWVRSRPGEGATFCIALPLSPEAMQAVENDFDGDPDDVSAETGTAEKPGTAHTASARTELGG
jgi:two-component system OmpR family sensor kinase